MNYHVKHSTQELLLWVYICLPELSCCSMKFTLKAIINNTMPKARPSSKSPLLVSSAIAVVTVRVVP